MSDKPQRIPVDTTEVKKSNPAALSNEETPPVFYLKAGGRREREAMEYAILEEGLSRLDDEQMRQLTIDELCLNWQCSPEDERVQRVKAYWRAVDDHVEEVSARQLEIEAAQDADEEPPEALPPFDHPDTEHFTDLMKRLTKASRPIREAGAANLRYRREFPRFTNAHIISNWTGLDTKPEFEAGVLTIDCVVAMQEEMAAKFGDRGHMAYSELSIETLKRVYLDRSTEKNSNSPAPSPWTPPIMRENGQASANGTSPESDSSDETPAAS